MSDIRVLEDKIDGVMVEVQKVEGKLETELKQVSFRFDEVDDRLDAHSDTINRLKQWGLGNGGPGAEDRLRVVEKCSVELDKANLPNRVAFVEADVVALQKIADGRMLDGIGNAVNATLDERSKTTVERMKAWGALLTPILAATAVVLAAVL